MAKRIVDIPNVGDVHFVKSARARRLTIRLTPFREVRVTVPNRTSYAAAKRFVHSHLEWLEKHSRKMKEYEADHLTTINATSGRGRINRDRAKTQLTARLRELADEFGYDYNRVTIRNQKTRWGSCSCANNINLNCNLVRLRDELIDYVLVHELVHTVHKNHSRDFWNELTGHIPEARKLDKELKKHHLGVI